MRILGIDPGIARAGWGIIEKEKTDFHAIAFDCIQTDSKRNIPDRLLTIYQQVIHIIDIHEPEVLAIEELFFNTNAKTAFIVGQARGVILLAAAAKKIPSVVYTPLQVKVALTGYGRAEKMQVGKMVKVLLKLSTIPSPDDTADALAVALTHGFFVKSH